MGGFQDDLRAAVRGLRKSGTFAVAVISLLALAIGANSALFSLANKALLEPLPYPEPQRLVQLWESKPESGLFRFGVSEPAFHDWPLESRGVERWLASSTSSANLAGPERPQRVRVARVAGDLVGVLGLGPIRGRSFRPDEQSAGHDAVVLVSEEFWRSGLAADESVLGKTLTLDGVPHEVIGVLPRSVGFPFEDVQIWKPLALHSGSERRGARWLEVFGRLRPGVEVRQARAEMEGLAARHAVAYPGSNKGWTIETVPFHEVTAGELRPTLLLLWSAVGLVLLVAAANVASLLLLRGMARARDVAVRAALGADSLRIARLLILESVLLALVGGVAGVVLGRGFVRIVGGLLGDAFPRPAGLDGTAVVFSLGLALATGLLSGLLPAVAAVRAPLDAALRSSGRGVAGAASLASRRFFVAAEIAVAVVLLVGAGLVVRSFLKVLDVPPGFDARNALTFRAAPAQVQPAANESEPQFVARYLGQRDQVAGFYESLLAGIASRPGVEAVGAVNRLPLTGRWWSISVQPEGAPPVPRDQQPVAYGRVVSPGYFAAMGIPLRKGRDFTPLDDKAPVIVVSETFARRHWPGTDPLGRRVAVDTLDGPWLTVVGIAGDVRGDGLEQEAKPTFYVPLRQATYGFYPDWGMDVIVRTRTAPEGFASVIRDEVRRLDPALPVFALETLEARLAASLARRRATAQLFAGFAAVALVLAAIGLAGLVAFSVRLRVREMGVRAALGARPRDLVSLVLREGLALSAVGAAAGFAGAAALSRLLASFLYATPALDPATFALTAGLLGVVALAACYAPARRAGRLDPLAALRQE
jgi:putative ABC transport system permease protein